MKDYCDTCGMRHAPCPTCGLPVSYNLRIHRSMNAHGNGPHYCISEQEHLAEWARAQINEVYAAMHEPMVADAPLLKEETPPTKPPEPPKKTPTPMQLSTLD